MMDNEQLRIAPDLLALMRRSVTNAIENGSEFVAPSHLMLALLADATVGPAITELVPHDKIVDAASNAASKLPEVAEVPEGQLPEGESAPFQRYDTLAFRSMDGSRTMYLDRIAYKLFIEGARRAPDVYRPKHLMIGIVAESVKDQSLLSLLGKDPGEIGSAVYEL